ncbi:hypothetical protein [Methanobacterium petrolearium]|uniref:hypothetical protein n=1 Tax=Methanobacterium petrolearium TaxID=710190 RepID=UPI001AE79CFD|nr:hypothetical protein [Methanobacterium petrolearium]MBP1945487.1 hypothetical protein [Methanobacterium petrolearium]BDZ71695.1 hypothetical protein GCM10025861_22120 [Methanobacterium petrolearium]
MYYYKAFGLEILSEIELPGMMAGLGNPDVKIILGTVNLPLTGEVEGPNYRVTDGEVYLWWEDIGKVKISKGELVCVEPIADLDGSDEVNIIPFLLGPVMALLLHQRGFLVLHGSSVNVNGVAVAFLGYRGNGKSTTAINLYKDGYPLVTDDILAIKFNKEGKPVVYPGYPHVRLNEDSYNLVKDNTDILTPIRTIVGKIFCDASHGFSPEPLICERIYVIEKGDTMGISTLKSQENLMDLIRHSVANRIFQHTTQKENLIHCAQLVNNVTVKQLEITHSFGKIQELVKMIEDDLERGD